MLRILLRNTLIHVWLVSGETLDKRMGNFAYFSLSACSSKGTGFTFGVNGLRFTTKFTPI